MVYTGKKPPSTTEAVTPSTREVPSLGAYSRGYVSEQAESQRVFNPFPDVSDKEPLIEVSEIQGNIVPGFLKDHVMLLFLKIDDVRNCKNWLKGLVPFISTAEEVLAFNRLFKQLRSRRGRETLAIKATWINIALTYDAIRQLTDLSSADFSDQAFKEGMVKRAAVLGDPTSPSKKNMEGNPDNWVISDRDADIVVMVQSDDVDDLNAQVEKIETSIFSRTRGTDGTSRSSGVRIVFMQRGQDLPRPFSGHEQFKFLDGVSQPGIRGYVKSTDGTDVLTPRQNPDNPNQGKPGQDLLWPGEFMFGYVYQDPKNTQDQKSSPSTSTSVPDPSNPTQMVEIHKGELAEAGPAWARNGSYMVFRRLRQDVGRFHTFLNAEARALNQSNPTFPPDPRFLGTKFVGRWPTGAPIMRATQTDNSELGRSDCANNDFEFMHPVNPCPDTPNSVTGCSNGALFPEPQADPSGMTCPFAAHIRKVYPRDDITPEGGGNSEASERHTQTHRLLRRGIPYGPVSPSSLEAPVIDGVDRGLLFVSYQSSIVGQFEFVSRFWIDNPDFPFNQAGFDFLIGQSNKPNDPTNNGNIISGRLPITDPNGPTIRWNQDWTITTGGGFYFCPSIQALREVLTV
ncbi:hypothetical protein EPA93_06675 [Ktedonosporobacter rubrisoli]|uniref:DyP dimeric alpha+beta barrel domain-containing protein n=1 Tax=Ktedonosporobacter rubrisoli TaxID=2509675 RepID=A0A4P6JKM2_KTERU|nr:hypothetical protein [Ktedonosporobacter rubrisoli]QBD75705.1 hypothetical protein EPA93_06675 [Ktedonosporobacter rubrisoli]